MRSIIVSAGLLPLDVRPDPDPRSPGVFALARKPWTWQTPWINGRDPLAVVEGVTRAPQQ
jgi:hypothetical protein